MLTGGHVIIYSKRPEANDRHEFYLTCADI